MPSAPINVEVRIHAQTREIRVPRWSESFAAADHEPPHRPANEMVDESRVDETRALQEANRDEPRNARYVNDHLRILVGPVNAAILELESACGRRRPRAVSRLVTALAELYQCRHTAGRRHTRV